MIAVEVPNPKHPDNIKIQNQQSQQRTTSFRRSVSISNLPKGTFHSNIKSDKTNSINYQTDKNPNLSLKIIIYIEITMIQNLLRKILKERQNFYLMVLKLLKPPLKNIHVMMIMMMRMMMRMMIHMMILMMFIDKLI